MTSQLVALRFDAHLPVAQARFWAAALRWSVAAETSESLRLVPTDQTPFEIVFVPGAETKVSQNRIHFDLTTETQVDQDESVRSLIELGGRHIDIGQGPEDTHVVLADPEGNEFCVIEPTNSFLATCERLGAVNCDGTQALGYFWSKVLGWPLVWDQDEETAIRAADGTGPLITWSGPPLIPKVAKERMQFVIAAPDMTAEIGRLVDLGATRIDTGHNDGEPVVMADVDGNEFFVITRP